MVSTLAKIPINSRISFQPTVIAVAKIKSNGIMNYWGNWDSVFPVSISKSVGKTNNV